jgi:hypothetical protein
MLRRHPDGDRERHRQRQRDDADDRAGEEIGSEGTRVVAGERLPDRGGERERRSWCDGRSEGLLAVRHGGRDLF